MSTAKFLTRSCVNPLLLAAILGCSSDPAAPEDFVLDGTWAGSLVITQIGAFDLQLTLEGDQDGEVETYGGDGLISGQQQITRFAQVDADYNTTTMNIELAILDFPITAALFTGSYDGTTITVEDTNVCKCEMTLTR